MIAAIAAAVLGGLGSIPLAYAGGLLLGVGQQLLFQYLPTNNIIASALKPALPFVVVFAVLVLSPVSRGAAPVSDPLVGCRPATAGTRARRAAATASRSMTRDLRGRVLRWSWATACSSTPTARGSTSRCAPTILVDHLLVDHGDHGLRGPDLAVPGDVRRGRRVPRPRSSRRSTGCRCSARWSSARCIAAVVGALLAIPMMRLGGIFLSLATLAFAFFFDQVILQLGWVGGGHADPRRAPAACSGSIDFSKGDKALSRALTLVILAMVSVAVIWVRSGTTGRTLDAMRGSEVAAASIGINRTPARGSSRSRSRPRSRASAAAC